MATVAKPRRAAAAAKRRTTAKPVAPPRKPNRRGWIEWSADQAAKMGAPPPRERDTADRGVGHLAKTEADWLRTVPGLSNVAGRIVRDSSPERLAVTLDNWRRHMTPAQLQRHIAFLNQREQRETRAVAVARRAATFTHQLPRDAQGGELYIVVGFVDSHGGGVGPDLLRCTFNASNDDLHSLLVGIVNGIRRAAIAPKGGAA